MKIALLTLILLLGMASLFAQVPNPRLFFLRVVNADGSSLPDTTGISFVATFHGVERTHKTHDFSITTGGGDVYARVQLGNFGVMWNEGDTLTVNVLRREPFSTTGPVSFTIPDGSDSIWWGCPPQWGDFPGEAVPLYPFVLNVIADTDIAQPILKDWIETGALTGQSLIADTEADISGEFSLAPPPSGWRWEPSKYVLTPRDFEFSESASTDAEGVSRPGWARTLEFRLVQSDPEG